MAAQRVGREFYRLLRGARFGHLTIRSGHSSCARSSSLATTRPRTETRAPWTLSAEPETNGCHCGKILAFGDEPIGAGDRQPAQRADDVRRQPDTIGHPTVAFVVVATAAGLRVEQPAADVGEVDIAGVFVLELDEAAAGAAVAQALPFVPVHLVQRLGAPERSGSRVLDCHSRRLDLSPWGTIGSRYRGFCMVRDARARLGQGHKYVKGIGRSGDPARA